MAAYNIHLSSIAVLISLFCVLCKACQETGNLDSNSQIIHGPGCQHLARDTLEHIQVLPVSGSASGENSHRHSDLALSSPLLISDSTIPTGPISPYLLSGVLRGSKFDRVSRGQMSRMPLQFGKRLNLKTELVLSQEESPRDFPFKQSGDFTSRQMRGNILRRGDRNLGETFWKDMNPQRGVLGLLQKELLGAVDSSTRDLVATGREGRLGSEGPNGYINQRVIRGRLDRMPSGFGKRSDARMSPLFHHIETQDSPAYENAIKRLANKFGIKFLRGNRARLSRMPHLYGRKRRDDGSGRFQSQGRVDNIGINSQKNWKAENDGDGASEVSAGHAIMSPYARESRNDVYSHDHSSLESTREPDNGQSFTNWRSSSAHLLLNALKQRANAIAQGEFKDFKLSPLSSGIRDELSGFGSGKRSTLSRMPLTFGKRAETGAHPSVPTAKECEMCDSRGYPNQDEDADTKSSSIHPARDDLSMISPRLSKPGSIDKEGEYTNNNNILDNSQVPSTLEPKLTSLDTIPRRVFGFKEQLRTSRRSALSRMPLTFGKRNNILIGGVREPNDYPLANNFGTHGSLEREDASLSLSGDRMDEKYETPRRGVREGDIPEAMLA